MGRPTLMLWVLALSVSSLACSTIEPPPGVEGADGSVTAATDGGGGGGDGDGSGDACQPMPPTPIDPATLPSCCPEYGGAHCLAADQVPASMHAKLTACTDGSLCVPDEYIAGGVEYQPPTCTSLGGAAGACVSGCIPEVGNVFDILPQDVCAAHQRCAPCIDPITQQSSGACEPAGQTCEPGDESGGEGGGDGGGTGPDAGPAPMPAASCCDGRGVCLAPEVIGDKADQLGPDTCPVDSGQLCVPEVFLDGSYTPPACKTVLLALIFGPEYEDGRCLAACLPGMDNFLLGQDGCAEAQKCAPCLDPTTGAPSGACEL